MNITVSGVDGSGKTTFCRYLSAKTNSPVVHTRLPAPLRPLSLLFLFITILLGCKVKNLYPATRSRKITSAFLWLTYFEMFCYTTLIRFIHRNRAIIWDRCHLDIMSDAVYFSNDIYLSGKRVSKMLHSLFTKGRTVSYVLEVDAAIAASRKQNEGHSKKDIEGRQEIMMMFASGKFDLGKFSKLNQSDLLSMYKQDGMFPELWSNSSFNWNEWYEKNRYNRTLLREYNGLDSLAKDMIPKEIQDKIAGYEDYVFDSLKLISSISADFHSGMIIHYFIKTLENFPDLGHDADIFFPPETSSMERGIKILKEKYNAEQLPSTLSEKITGKYNFRIPGHELVIECHKAFMSQVGENIKMNSLMAIIPNIKAFTMRGNSFGVHVSNEMTEYIVLVLHSIYRHYRLRYCDVLHARQMISQISSNVPLNSLLDYTMKGIGIYDGCKVLVEYANDQNITVEKCPIFIPEMVAAKLWFNRVKFFFHKKQYISSIKYFILYPSLLVSMFITHKLFKRNWTW